MVEIRPFNPDPKPISILKRPSIGQSVANVVTDESSISLSSLSSSKSNSTDTSVENSTDRWTYTSKEFASLPYTHFSHTCTTCPHCNHTVFECDDTTKGTYCYKFVKSYVEKEKKERIVSIRECRRKFIEVYNALQNKLDVFAKDSQGPRFDWIPPTCIKQGSQLQAEYLGADQYRRYIGE